MKGVKFTSMKNEKKIGEINSIIIAPKEPDLFLARSKKANQTGGYLRTFPLCLSLKSLVLINKNNSNFNRKKINWKDIE